MTLLGLNFYVFSWPISEECCQGNVMMTLRLLVKSFSITALTKCLKC